MSKKKPQIPSIQEYENRVNTIIGLCLSATPRYEILQIVAKMGWKVCDRTIDSYIQEANKRIKETQVPERAEWIKEAKARFENLYNMSYLKTDFPECRRILESMCKVFGYAQINVNANIQGTVDIKTEEYKKQVAEMTDEELEKELERWDKLERKANRNKLPITK